MKFRMEAEERERLTNMWVDLRDVFQKVAENLGLVNTGDSAIDLAEQDSELVYYHSDDDYENEIYWRLSSDEVIVKLFYSMGTWGCSDLYLEISFNEEKLINDLHKLLTDMSLKTFTHTNRA